MPFSFLTHPSFAQDISQTLFDAPYSDLLEILFAPCLGKLGQAEPRVIKTRGRFRFGRVCVRAASIPTVTHRSRTRSTVRAAALNALAISASIKPPPACASSAISRMRARLKRRADPVPVFTCASSSLRSSSVKRTRYRFAGIFPLLVSAFPESLPLFYMSVRPCLLHY